MGEPGRQRPHVHQIMELGHCPGGDSKPPKEFEYREVNNHVCDVGMSFVPRMEDKQGNPFGHSRSDQ